MSQRPFSWELFTKCPIVGIVRHLTADEVAAMLPIYLESGLTTIEITMNTPGASEMILAAQTHYSGQLNLGAGTVRTLTDLENALAAGAQFIVTPTLNEPIVRRCVEQGIPIFPGAFTPTEIERAWQLGASMVKVYPAGMFGPDYIRDIKAPLDDVKLLPTGGVNQSNMAEYRNAGADGVAMGSQLIDKSLIRQRDWAGLKAHFLAIKRAFDGQ